MEAVVDLYHPEQGAVPQEHEEIQTAERQCHPVAAHRQTRNPSEDEGQGAGPSPIGSRHLMH